MEIPFARWYPAISYRHSRRKYDSMKPIPPDTVSNVQKICQDFRPFPNVRSILITEKAEKAFKFILGASGGEV